MTVLEVLQSTTAYFKERGIENARLNAEHLLAHALGRKRLDIYLEFERQLAEAELAPLRDLVRRRGQREPLQHLLGTIEFSGQTFRCDQRALVPRPETEEMVESLCALPFPSDARMADVGTGSGVIALTLAHRFSQASIVATDISAEALALARENAGRLGLSYRVEFQQANLLEEVGGQFDLIVANLPYISTHDRTELAPEVLRDPEVALFAGETGEELIRELIETAPPRLRAGGLLALEIGFGQAQGLADLLRAKNYHDIEAKSDYGGVTRFLLARYG